MMRRVTDRPRLIGGAILIVVCASILGGACSSHLRTAEAEDVPVPRELPYGIQRWHDAVMGVTCWQLVYAGASLPGLSCLPDQWLLPAQEPES